MLTLLVDDAYISAKTYSWFIWIYLILIIQCKQISINLYTLHRWNRNRFMHACCFPYIYISRKLMIQVCIYIYACRYIRCRHWSCSDECISSPSWRFRNLASTNSIHILSFCLLFKKSFCSFSLSDLSYAYMILWSIYDLYSCMQSKNK